MRTTWSRRGLFGAVVSEVAVHGQRSIALGLRRAGTSQWKCVGEGSCSDPGRKEGGPGEGEREGLGEDRPLQGHTPVTSFLQRGSHLSSPL